MDEVKQERRNTCQHRGTEPIRVGVHLIYAGGTQYLQSRDEDDFDTLVALTEGLPSWCEDHLALRHYPIPDMAGVPTNFSGFLRELIQRLERGEKILVFCVGSHGRTGTVLAGLIALLEPEIEDPIAAVRTRHCSKSVETRAQAKAIQRIHQTSRRAWSRRCEKESP